MRRDYEQINLRKSEVSERQISTEWINIDRLELSVSVSIRVKWTDAFGHRDVLVIARMS